MLLDVTCTIIFHHVYCAHLNAALHSTSLSPIYKQSREKHNEGKGKGRKRGRERREGEERREGKEGGKGGKEERRKEGGGERRKEGGKEGKRKGRRKEEKGRRDPTTIFCPPLVLCKALLHWRTSIRSLFSVSSIVSMAVITSGLPAWRHFRRVEERVGLWVRREKEGGI